MKQENQPATLVVAAEALGGDELIRVLTEAFRKLLLPQKLPE